MGLILDMSPRLLEEVSVFCILYCDRSRPDAVLEQKQLLTEKEYR